MTTCHRNAKYNNEKNKPEIVVAYNNTKYGVDQLDKMCSRSTFSIISNRWTLKIFKWLIDVAGINSQILFKQHHKDNNYSANGFRRKFLTILSQQLMEVQQKRLLNLS